MGLKFVQNNGRKISKKVVEIHNEVRNGQISWALWFLFRLLNFQHIIFLRNFSLFGDRITNSKNFSSFDTFSSIFESVLNFEQCFKIPPNYSNSTLKVDILKNFFMKFEIDKFLYKIGWVGNDLTALNLNFTSLGSCYFPYLLCLVLRKGDLK